NSRFAGAEAFRPSVPVISVGNIAVGGTGKTPCVISLVRFICQIHPELAAPNAIAVLSRGYGRESRELVVVQPEDDYQKTGDEPLLIKRALPHAAVVVHAERVLSAAYAVETLHSRLLVLDDGFQHRFIARDLDLVLVDGNKPLGNNRLLPAGPLREPAEALIRAQAIGAIGTDTQNARSLAEKFAKPFLAFLPRIQLPRELSTNLSTPVLVLTSIARPSRFHNQLKEMGLVIKQTVSFPDHHPFSVRDLNEVVAAVKLSGAVAVVTTAKDKIRIRDWNYLIPLFTADLALIPESADNFQSILEPLLTKCVA
ncbi:tetraacyldisaccharide 4'-kinase, partial [candidate division KSB1 bacterium]